MVRWSFALICLLGMALRAAEGVITVEAVDFDASNARVVQHGESYADGPACIFNKGETPNWTEYVLDIPVTADYTVAVLYAAAQSRPVQILVDGNVVVTGLKGVTGEWQTSSAQWEDQCVTRIAKGSHVVTLRTDSIFPHICALRLRCAEAFPEGWQLVRLTPEQRAERIRVRQEKERLEEKIAELTALDPAAVRRAVTDLAETFPGTFDAARYLPLLDRLDTERARLMQEAKDGGKEGTIAAIDALAAEVRTALLANPLLDFDRVLVVKRNLPGGRARSAVGADAGFVPTNFQNHAVLRKGSWDNEIAVLSNLRGQPRLESLYQPPAGRLLRDVRLEYDGNRLLFSSLDDKGRWALYEVTSEGKELHCLTPTDYPDLDFFQGCYLPDGRIILCSTANYYGLPCLNGDGQIASLYLLDPKTKSLRQLTFDQDSDNDPVVLNDGRVLFQRWEYSDIPHYFSRRRMTMLPDGTGQLALHGSNSWFPTAFRFAQPVPDSTTRLVGIISGHHDFGDCGRLVVLDPALAATYPFRFRPTSKEWGEPGEHMAVTPDILPAEKTGFVQTIPGWGKPVAGTVCDDTVRGLFLKESPLLATHPYPLSSKYFLVAMKPTAKSLWGIYLVDVFDNLTRIAEFEDTALFEPIPFRPRPRPPVIPDRVKLDATTAEVHVADIYQGPGLAGVPRGTVAAVRVFAYHFGYIGKAGPGVVGIHSGWDAKRVLGTAKVENDGSVRFRIPANTPVSLQPLDKEGRAIQLMRSWLVGMPGERVSCVGCHEMRGTTLPRRRAVADEREAEELRPWFGPPRPFLFANEVQPVLEKFCVGCHTGPALVGPRSKPCFKTADTSYAGLHPYVHRPGVESDMALLNPMEYHASTSPLIRMLEKGHHGVKLAAMGPEAKERLYCWIDLNAPKNGQWKPPEWQGADPAQRRCELAKTFANLDTNPEAEAQAALAQAAERPAVAYVAPPAEAPVPPDEVQAAAFPMPAGWAEHLQNGRERTLTLAEGVQVTLRWIPAGEFVMGSLDGAADERPRTKVSIAKPFWLGTTEVTNRQYAVFNPDHDTRYIDMHGIDRVTPGYIANHPDQPVARVSWQEATAFCAWLGQQTGGEVVLPTEAQWEWAARAGTATPFFFGGMNADFGRFANLADQSLRWFRTGFPGAGCLQPRMPYPPEMNFPLHDERFQDPYFVVDYVGQTEANAWGLRDMVGNVSEWTRSCYRAYPYADDGRNDAAGSERRVARGGSWADRPIDAGSSVRYAYEPWQKVYDVGFRIAVED